MPLARSDHDGNVFYDGKTDWMAKRDKRTEQATAYFIVLPVCEDAGFVALLRNVVD
ncbi:hypothetical protein [Sodalis sp.]|uniref:hypothetical protein n=1 Tax=Sodalis sp. (in: enterobacteria) TaxID=1898979 RepID=UPI003872CE40